MHVGIDIGYSNLKLVYGIGHEQVETLILPAGAAPLAHLPSAGSAEGESFVRVVVEDGEYGTCVDQSTIDNFPRTLNRKYSSTPAYQAIYRAALERVGVPGIEHLTTGLPVDRYYNEEDPARFIGRALAFNGGSLEIQMTEEVLALSW